MVREFLSRAGRTFTEKNVEEDEAAYRELITLGYRTVPITLIGRHVVKGFDEPKLRAALADAGGSRPGR